MSSSSIIKIDLVKSFLLTYLIPFNQWSDPVKVFRAWVFGISLSASNDNAISVPYTWTQYDAFTLHLLERPRKMPRSGLSFTHPDLIFVFLLQICLTTIQCSKIQKSNFLLGSSLLFAYYITGHDENIFTLTLNSDFVLVKVIFVCFF